MQRGIPPSPAPYPVPATVEPKFPDGSLKGAFSWSYAAALIAVLAFIGAARLESYLLFHTVVELFTVIVSVGIFSLAWHTRRFHENHYLLTVGISLLFTGIVDLLHTMAYKGMGVFAASSDVPTQLWIAGRFIQSVSLLIAPVFLGRKLNTTAAFCAGAGVTAFLTASIFLYHVFPVCHVEGSGLTPFKIWSEYAVIVLLLAALAYLRRKRAGFDREIYRSLAFSIWLTIAAEACFTLYVDVYGAFNMAGHLLRLASISVLYRALLVTGLMRPNLLLFRSLTESEEALRRSNARLQSVVEALRAADERYRAFVAASSEGICRFELAAPVSTSEHPARLMQMLWDQARLAECNLVYARMNGCADPQDLIGRELSSLVSGTAQLLAEFVKSGFKLADFEVTGPDSSGSPRWITTNLTGSVQQDRIVRIWGVHRDHTERKLAALERERLIEELKTALAEVRRLGGLLPICSQCKKIRDDRGYWNQVEAYIAERTGAEFSHGICPECLEAHFGEYLDAVPSE